MAALTRTYLSVSFLGSRRIHRWVAPTLRALYKRRKEIGPETPTHRSTLLNWNFNAELYAFGKRLNEAFDKETLRAAFTHRSYVEAETEKRKELGIAEMEEFKPTENSGLIDDGEQLMKSYVGAYLRHTHSHFPEEGIIAVQEFLLSDEILGHVSSNIGTSDLILCEDFPPSASTLAKTLKAIVGALIKCSGAERAELFVQDFVLTQLVGRDVNEMWTIDNPMGLLVDILRRENRALPESRLIRESGRNTIMAVFNVGVYSDKHLLGIGFGESVPIAEEMAARDALKTMFRTKQTAAPLPFGCDGHRRHGRRFSIVHGGSGTTNPSVQVWTTELADRRANSADKLPATTRKAANILIG